MDAQREPSCRRQTTEVSVSTKGLCNGVCRAVSTGPDSGGISWTILTMGETDSSLAASRELPAAVIVDHGTALEDRLQISADTKSALANVLLRTQRSKSGRSGAADLAAESS